MSKASVSSLRDSNARRVTQPPLWRRSLKRLNPRLKLFETPLERVGLDAAQLGVDLTAMVGPNVEQRNRENQGDRDHSENHIRRRFVAHPDVTKYRSLKRLNLFAFLPPPERSLIVLRGCRCCFREIVTVMFVGHFAVGLAAKRVAPRVSLGVLFIACQALDLIWPVLVLAGVEKVQVDHSATAFTPFDFVHYPWSHSLLMSAVWSAVAFAVLRLLRRSNLEAGVVAAVVLSHWLLDFLTHRPDLPVAFGSTKLGLGLWQSVAATLVVEVALFVGAVLVYARVTTAETARGRWGYWTLIAFLGLTYAANAFSPKPPLDLAPAAIATPALAMWLIVAWAHWADKERRPLTHSDDSSRSIPST